MVHNIINLVYDGEKYIFSNNEYKHSGVIDAKSKYAITIGVPKGYTHIILNLRTDDTCTVIFRDSFDCNDFDTAGKKYEHDGMQKTYVVEVYGNCMLVEIINDKDNKIKYNLHITFKKVVEW